MFPRVFVVWFACCRCCAVMAQLTAYDPEIAKQFAALASVPYCGDAKHVMDWTCKTCAEARTPLVPGKIKLIDVGTYNATRVLVGKLRDQAGCLLSFRGSDNLENWIRDLDFLKVYPSDYADCEGCKVHTGFYKVWSNTMDPVLSAIREVGCSQNGTDNLLYITGHSLGAALTHLAMFTLESAGFNIAKTYSFEAPRIGNNKFADAFNERFERKFPVFRISHYKDPVVHLPPVSFGYTHVQTEVWYDSSGGWTVCPGVENKSCADRYWDVPLLLLYAGNHCSSSLVSTGSICSPDCSSASASVLI